MPDAATERLGELDRSGDAWRLKFTRVLPHAPERVWRALTEPAELAAWFPTTIDGDRAAGAHLVFRFKEDKAPPFEGRMIACDQPQLLEFMWGEDQIRIELAAVATGTQLTLYDTLDQNGKASRDAAGWHVCLDELAASLAGADGSGSDWRPLNERYSDVFGPEASTIGPPEGFE
jgi:uncharacterized protein YndB with AHSA1/START domain